jgi:hypothetical protein
MEYDNPAERLLAILKKGQGIETTTNCMEAWQSLLDCSGNPPLLMSRLGKVMELPQAIILAMRESYPTREGIWSHWESQVNTAFMVQNLHANWATFIGNIDHNSMTFLQMTSEMLQAKSSTKLLSQEKLKELTDVLTTLCCDLEVSEINHEVKKYTLRYLRKLIVSLEEYRLTGALPVLESAEMMMGHTVVDPSYKAFLEKTDIGARVASILSATANLMTIATGIPQLTTNISTFLNYIK